MECEENLDYMNQIESINADDINSDDEVIDDPLDDPKYCIDHDIHRENLLHYFTDISTNEFCSSLLTLLRKSNTCKLHANRLLAFISSILPAPNNVPKKMEDLLKQLEISNNTFKKYLSCKSCKEYVSFQNDFFSKCLSNDSRRFAFVYDMDAEESIKNIYIRLERDINEYRNQLRLMDDHDLTNNIGLNNLYQQLLRVIMINENYRINIKFLSITGDSPALGIGHNGYCCCHFSYIRGIHTEKKRQYFYEEKVFLCDIEKYDKHSQQAEETRKIAYGHKGKLLI
ncbi:unnamed protein product [Adineta steineri]|uniref:Uncharacterized protein n=1 Tax=Adineta steineri TaxID=433720 RepID=A0A815HQL9_9BILA|nr:unnamed protein product [Adineta steineri]